LSRDTVRLRAPSFWRLAVLLPQQRLPVLLALYDRKLKEVAPAAGVSVPYASEVINGRREASPELIARIEAAIVGLPSFIRAREEVVG